MEDGAKRPQLLESRSQGGSPRFANIVVAKSERGLEYSASTRMCGRGYVRIENAVDDDPPQRMSAFRRGPVDKSRGRLCQRGQFDPGLAARPLDRVFDQIDQQTMVLDAQVT
jgi:hypothetical protein